MSIKQDKNYQLLDLRTLRCPDPIMLLRKKIREIKTGNILLILADDPSTIRDIPNFCRFMKHILLKLIINKLPYQFLIKKGNVSSYIYKNKL
ncbi:MAG: sulfurtransferase TusA [Buchnera aphidicola (Meitanaphis elongallis)]